MAKQRGRRGHRQREQTSPETSRRLRADASHRGDYDLAIAAWRRVSRTHRDPDFSAALAEVCFRRGLKGHMDSLRQAVEIASQNTPVGHFKFMDLEPETPGESWGFILSYDLDVSGILQVETQSRCG